MRDGLYYDIGSNEEQFGLYNWAVNALPHKVFAPDYHRCQIERWLWDSRPKMGDIIADIGSSESPRRWMGDGYFTFGLYRSDVIGDLREFPFHDSLDAIVCTEVMEHCADPFRAAEQMRQGLVKGGRLFASAPFCWPDHATQDYDDYWRFTRQGWSLLLKDFEQVEVTATKWTDEGAQMYEMMRRFEGFGFREDVEMTTGYMVEAMR